MHLVTSYGMGAAAVTQEPHTYYDPGSLNADPSMGMVTEKWDEATRSWYPVNPYLGRMQGAAPPPTGTTPLNPFNCPSGSDYAASQEVGMCVGADYDPVYTQSYPGAVKVYHSLDGTVAGTSDAPAPVNVPKRDPPGDWIPGVPNMAIVGVAGFMFVAWMRKR